MVSGGPVWPNPSMPQAAQVDGRNCIGPSAPAGEGPLLPPSALSSWPMAASTVQDNSGQYLATDSWNPCSSVAGSCPAPTPPPPCPSSPSSPRLSLPPPPPTPPP